MQQPKTKRNYGLAILAQMDKQKLPLTYLSRYGVKNQRKMADFFFGMGDISEYQQIYRDLLDRESQTSNAD